MSTKPQSTTLFNFAIIIALLLSPILPSQSYRATTPRAESAIIEPAVEAADVSRTPVITDDAASATGPATPLSAAEKFHLNASTHFVVINSSGIEPATITIEVGDSVTWHNATNTTIRLKSGTPPDSGNPSPDTTVFLPLISRIGQPVASAAQSTIPPVASTVGAGDGDFDQQLAPGADFDYQFKTAKAVAYYVERTGNPTGRVLVETPQPTTILESSPANGEDGVATTRETIIEFSRPINAAGVTAANFNARFGSRELDARLQPSADGKRVTLFYATPLPASARVQVTVNGDGLSDSSGQKIDADGDGQPGGTATIDFDTLSVTVVPGTSVCGRVFASELAADGTTAVNVPLQGATITVDGMASTLKATTNGEGNFCLDPAPAGRFFVHIDGRTATNGVPSGAYYPFVGKAWGSVVGQQSNIGNIYLPLVKPGTLQDVSNTQDTRIGFAPSVQQQFPEFANVEIYVPANSLMRDDGTRGGKVGIAPVPPDRLPGELPEGLNFPLVVTVQTDGATNFDKPAPICFPNLPDPDTNVTLAAGEKSALWSFNHDTGHFEVVGPMTVSDDGTLVCTDPGVGVPAPGWHGSQPGTSWSYKLNSILGRTNTADSPGKWPQPDKQIKCDTSDGAYYTNGNLQVGATNQEAANNRAAIQRSINDSINGIAVIGAAGTSPLGASFFSGFSNEKGFDHVAVAYEDSNSNTIKIIELLPDDSILGSLNPASRTLDDFASAYDRVTAVPVNLSNAFGQSFLDSLQNNLAPGAIYSFTPSGNTCATSIADSVRESGLDPDFGDPIGINNFQVTPWDVINYFKERNKKLNNLDKCTLSVDGEFKASVTTSSLDNEQTNQSYYYRVDTFRDNGSHNIYRGTTSNVGTLSLILPTDVAGYALFYDATNSTVAGSIFSNEVVGRNIELQIDAIIGNAIYGLDSDKDSLIDIGEDVIGTKIDNPDTDNDGIPDGTEVQNGTDPLDGIAARTGVVGAADTPGTALDVCVANNLAAVADGAEGVALFNIFDAMNPTIVAQVDTPGTAQAIGCDNGLVAVADKDSGVAIIDTRNPANAAIRKQVALTGAAQAVATVNSLVYAGSASGQLAVIDSVNGDILGTVNLGEAIDEIVVSGDNLYVLTKTALVIYALWDGGLAELGRTAVAGSVSPLEYGRKLFVGGSRAYVGYFTGYAIFDVSNPATPRLQGSPPATQAAIHGLASTGSGELVAVTSFSGPNSLAVSLYDDSDPTNVTKFLTSYDTPGSPRAVALYNGLAYVADSTAGLQVVNYLSYDSGRTAPTLTLGGSFSGDRVEENKLTRVTANATDDVQVRLVEFYVDGALVATDGSYPFEQRFVTPRMADQATVKLRVRAVDTGGNETWTNEQTLILVPDATPPRVLRYTPAAGTNPANSVRGLSITFSEAINQSTLTVANLKVVAAGADNQLGTGDDSLLPGGTLAFDAETNIASLTFGTPLPAGIYRATVAAAISDPAGNKLAADLVWDFGVGQRIPIGTVIAGEIGVAGEQDVYNFVATPGQRVYFDDQNASRQSYFYWKLQDTSGKQIFQDTIDGSDPGVYILELGGEYTLTAWGYQTTTGAYQFQLRSNPPDEFAIAIGDIIKDGQPGSGAGRIEIPGDVDQYTFTATPNQRVYFDDQNASRPNYFYWNLYDSSGTRIFQDSLDDSDPGVYILEKGGTYTINAWSYVNNAGTYQFQLRSNPPDKFAINIGDVVKDGQPGSGAGNIEIPGNVDQYTFTATPNQRVYFDDQNASRSGYFYWNLYDSSGTRIFQDTLDNSDPGVYYLEKGGEYTINVWSYVNNAGTYQFQLRSTPPDSFAITIGDIIQDGQPGVGAGNIEIAGNVDQYIFTATPNQRVYFDDQNASRPNYFYWNLYDSSGTRIFQEDLDNADPGVYILEKGGNYTISVWTYQNTAGTYQFQLRSNPPDQFAITIGEIIQDNQPGTGAGNIEIPGNVDTYTFTATPNQRVYFDDQNASRPNYFYWNLYDSSGTRIFQEDLDDSDPGVYLLAKGGEYTINVWAYQNTFGTYQFQLRSNPPNKFTISVDTTVSDGQPGEGAGKIEEPGNFDQYTFTAIPGQSVYFDDQGASRLSYFYWDLYDASGKRIFQDTINNTDPGAYTLTLGGEYTITAWSYVNVFGTYQFQIRNPTAVDAAAPRDTDIITAEATNGDEALPALPMPIPATVDPEPIKSDPDNPPVEDEDSLYLPLIVSE